MQNVSPKPASVKGSLWLALRLAWNLGYLIAIPVAALGFGGAYLDRYLGTSPLFLLSGFVLAALFSGFAVKRRIREILPDPQ